MRYSHFHSTLLLFVYFSPLWNPKKDVCRSSEEVLCRIRPTSCANLWCPRLVCDTGAEKTKSLYPGLLVAIPTGKGRSKLNSYLLLRASKAPFPDHQETQGLPSCSLMCLSLRSFFRAPLVQYEYSKFNLSVFFWFVDVSSLKIHVLVSFSSILRWFIWCSSVFSIKNWFFIWLQSSSSLSRLRLIWLN